MNNDIAWETEGLVRKRLKLTNFQAPQVSVEGVSCLNFCSNDYLNLSQTSLVKEALVEGINRYGYGSGGSALVCGYAAITADFEQAFADWFTAPESILLSSGTLANQAAMTTLANRQTIVIADKYCHASLLDGIQLSRAKLYRYQHQDLTHLETLLKQHGQQALLVTEGIFSMEGALTPLRAIAKLAEQYGARLYVDEAHSAGVLGAQGRGACSAAGLTLNDESMTAGLIGCSVPLGKAFAGCGGLVVGGSALIRAIVQQARSYCYNTTMPAALSHANLTTLKLIRAADHLRLSLVKKCERFNRLAKTYALPLINEALTPIRCLRISDNHRVQVLQQRLLTQGFFVSAIRPPSVPAGTARLRISLNVGHTDTDLRRLVETLAIEIDR